LAWVFAYAINVRVSQEMVILHYNVDFGVDLIGNVAQVYSIPFLGFIFLLANFVLAAALTQNKHFKFFIHILLATVIVAHLLFFGGLTSIYLINLG
jgi:hypothetical protein